MLQKPNFRNWSGRQDSNLRPSGPKPDALPGCATPRPKLERIAKLSGRCNASGKPLCNQMTHAGQIGRGEICSGDVRWWARQESNPQPSRYERPALPLSYRPPAPSCDSLKPIMLASRHAPGHQESLGQRHRRRSSGCHRHRVPACRSAAV